MKHRLDKLLVEKGLVLNRSQASNYIKLGRVSVNNQIVKKSGFLVGEDDKLVVHQKERYVSRAGLKLESIAKALNLYFDGKTVLDVGSSTGGFTDYALRNGAKKVWAVDVGSDQLHASLQQDDRIELNEKTDIRDFSLAKEKPGIVLIDVSFISLRKILPHVFEKLSSKSTLIVAMVKPQFEAGRDQTNRGVVKNEKDRRQIFKDFEIWVKRYVVIVNKKDSEVAGQKGNRERFYVLKLPRS